MCGELPSLASKCKQMQLESQLAIRCICTKACALTFLSLCTQAELFSPWCYVIRTLLPPAPPLSHPPFGPGYGWSVGLYGISYHRVLPITRIRLPTRSGGMCLCSRETPVEKCLAHTELNPLAGLMRGTSLMRNTPLLGPCSRMVPYERGTPERTYNHTPSATMRPYA